MSSPTAVDLMLDGFWAGSQSATWSATTRIAVPGRGRNGGQPRLWALLLPSAKRSAYAALHSRCVLHDAEASRGHRQPCGL